MGGRQPRRLRLGWSPAARLPSHLDFGPSPASGQRPPAAPEPAPAPAPPRPAGSALEAARAAVASARSRAPVSPTRRGFGGGSERATPSADDGGGPRPGAALPGGGIGQEAFARPGRTTTAKLPSDWLGFGAEEEDDDWWLAPASGGAASASPGGVPTPGGGGGGAAATSWGPPAQEGGGRPAPSLGPHSPGAPSFGAHVPSPEQLRKNSPRRGSLPFADPTDDAHPVSSLSFEAANAGDEEEVPARVVEATRAAGVGIEAAATETVGGVAEDFERTVSGEELGENGYWLRWTETWGRSADGSKQWRARWWESSDWAGSREMGAEKWGWDGDGNAWRESWKETLSVDESTGRPDVRREAAKWGRNAASREEWDERWHERYRSAGGAADKEADKWARKGHEVWHERWGETYDGDGGCVKWTDKWAERPAGALRGEAAGGGAGAAGDAGGRGDGDGDAGAALRAYPGHATIPLDGAPVPEGLAGEAGGAGAPALPPADGSPSFSPPPDPFDPTPPQALEQWGEKWEERFKGGTGEKRGESWSVDGASGNRWNRWWGEDHLGGGVVRRHGHATDGEHWDVTDDGGTYYNPIPHFTYTMALEHSPQLLSVPELPREAVGGLAEGGFDELFFPPADGGPAADGDPGTAAAGAAGGDA